MSFRCNLLVPRAFRASHAHRAARGHPPAFVLYTLVMAVALFACGGAGSDSVAPTANAAAQIAITPSAPAIALGSQLALQAQVHDASGELVPGATVFWSSADSNVVTVSSTGVVTGKTVGTAQVAASSGGQSAIVAVSVSPVPVASLVVAPSTATLTIGGTVALQAVAYDANGQGLSGRSVIWASSAPQVATVDASGTVTAAAVAGTATVTGTCEGKTASATISVTLVPIASVSVAPGSATLTVGQTASFSAIATDANGNVISGRPVAWSSANGAIATVSSLGLVTATGAGTTTITATAEGKNGVAQIVVTAVTPPPPVASVTVTPSTTSVTVGGSVTLSAILHDASGATLSGRTVTWSTNAPTIATVSSTGLVSATGAGTATIAAASEGKNGGATVTVTPVPVASVAVSPATASLSVGQTVTLSATAKDAGGNVLSGRSVTWSSTTPSVATVSANGVVTAVDAGSATITATIQGQASTAQITVTPAPVATVQVTPANTELHNNHAKNLTAQVFDANHNELNGRTIIWSSSDSSSVTITRTGPSTASVQATGDSNGSVTITATCEGVSGIVTVTVTGSD